MRMTKESEWSARVADWRASGLSAAKYCAERGIRTKTLLWWSSRLQQKEKAGALSRPAEITRLARVIRAPGTTENMPVVIHVGNARVEVSRSADRAALSLVFEALGIMPLSSTP